MISKACAGFLGLNVIFEQIIIVTSLNFLDGLKKLWQAVSS